VKNQYFGDVRDFFKYGVLRGLALEAGEGLTVCWMLTGNDDSGYGAQTGYLQSERGERLRTHSPRLFDALHQLVLRNGAREVSRATHEAILPRARFITTPVPELLLERRAWFDAVLAAAEGSQLLFFDPDNGLEVKAHPLGSEGSSKYLYWAELADAVRAGHSCICFQYFRLRPSEANVESRGIEVTRRFPGMPVVSFATPDVAFFLVVRPEHPHLLDRSREIGENWEGEVNVRFWRNDQAG